MNSFSSCVRSCDHLSANRCVFERLTLFSTLQFSSFATTFHFLPPHPPIHTRSRASKLCRSKIKE